MGKIAIVASLNRSATEMKLYAVRSAHWNSARSHGRNWPCGKCLLHDKKLLADLDGIFQRVPHLLPDAPRQMTDLLCDLASRGE